MNAPSLRISFPLLPRANMVCYFSRNQPLLRLVAQMFQKPVLSDEVCWFLQSLINVSSSSSAVAIVFLLEYVTVLSHV
jgi:hypothetical protein